MTPPFTYADAARLVPVDVQAEESLAGWAIVDAGIADRVIDEFNDDDFHDRRCWQVIEAAAATPALGDGDKEWADAQRLGHGLVSHGCAARADTIANGTGIEWAWLAQLVERRSAEDWHRLVQRVVAASDRRLVNRELVAQLERNNVDVRWLTDLDAIVGDAQAAVLAVAQAVGLYLFHGGAEAEVADTCFRLGRLFAVDDAALHDAFMQRARGQEDGNDLR